MIKLYYLLSNERVMYVGLTKNVSERRSAHTRLKPPHVFVVVEEFTDPAIAAAAERHHIEQHSTFPKMWNNSPGGEYDSSSGYDRSGIGGVSKGTLPWNYRKAGVFSDSTRKAWSDKRKGKVHSSKMTTEQWQQVIDLFHQRPHIDTAGTTSKNGRTLPYKRAFCNRYASMFNVTSANLYRLLKNEK